MHYNHFKIVLSIFLLLCAISPVCAQFEPSVNFSSTLRSGQVPLTVDFTDESTGDPVSWLWNFGDGETSALKNPSHTYTEAGTYSVLLQVSNSYGSSSLTRSDYIVVISGGVSPTAEFFSLVRTGTPPLAVQYTDESTGDPVSWLWDFGDGETSVLQNPEHLYSDVGVYTVSLSATNGKGTGQNSKTDYIVVIGISGSLNADFSASPVEGTAPLRVYFTDLSTSSPESWLWDFGDGEISTEKNPEHMYTESGTYTVSLSFENDGGTAYKRKDALIQVNILYPDDPVRNPGFRNPDVDTPRPYVNFSAEPLSGDYPLKVYFTDLSIPEPSLWLWDFGDGRLSNHCDPYHTYDSPGKYSVSLKVTNYYGSSNITEKVDYIVVGGVFSDENGNISTKVSDKDNACDLPEENSLDSDKNSKSATLINPTMTLLKDSDDSVNSSLNSDVDTGGGVFSWIWIILIFLVISGIAYYGWNNRSSGDL